MSENIGHFLTRSGRPPETREAVAIVVALVYIKFRWIRNMLREWGVSDTELTTHDQLERGVKVENIHSIKIE